MSLTEGLSCFVPSEEVAPLDGNRSYLVTDEFLTLKSLRVHSVYKTLHCVSCETAWEPSAMPSHLQSHGITITKQEQDHFAESLRNFNVISTAAEVKLPASRGPPVECLVIVQKGHCCNECHYCAPTFGTFKNHWSAVHRDVQIPASISFHHGFIQNFFKSHQCWFEVLPALISMPSTDVFDAYLQHQVPKFQSTLVVPPIHVRETPPMLQVTGWHLHLQEYTRTRASIECIRSLVQVPPLRQTQGLGRLRQIVFDYMTDIRTKAQNSSIGVKSLLMECPR